MPVASSVDGCTVHTANKYELCDTCGEPGWYKDTTTNTCKKCAVGGCTCTTSGTTECTGCINNKHKYDSSVTPNVCKACTVDKCVKCTADAAKCEECDTGYFTETDGSKCTACPENCATCAADKTKCDAGKCKAGFYVYTFSVTGATTAKYCAACPSNCKTCTIAATGKATCDVCITGNYLSATKTCTNADCSGTDGKACIKCTYGKILKDGKC